MTITDESITEFREYLHVAEKADNTILKYVHDVSELKAYLEGKEITRRF
ncbi:MAG: hypothetical protein IKX06_01300 [Clostridia bacterium]|nr:hypothetical protein [Clostridia bacterium]